jgi:pimeloyl-ACP methyl ester carboxylesterase
VPDALPMMPPVQYADVNGIRMAYYEAGPKTGVPIVLCHGFPELAFSWRHQIKALADAGRWVIAPDQRGYGLTEAPKPVEDYDIRHLTGDMAGLLDHLGAKKAIFVGHDWGGIIVWQMPLLHPDRVAGVVGVNTPFMARAPVDPIAIMRNRMGDEMYIVHFQKPGEADAILGGDARRSMDFFMRGPLLGMPPSAGMAVQRKPGDPSAFAIVRIIEAWDPAVDPRPKFLTPEEFEVFASTFERTGFTGGINWYRNFTRNWQLSEGVEQKVTQPGLMIMAENDAVLPPSAADGMEAYVPDLEKTLVTKSGHWTQQEEPEQTNRALINWLDKRFPL